MSDPYERPENPFGAVDPSVRAQDSRAVVAVEQERALAEVQAAILLAKRFPRDQRAAVDRILMACARPKLAEAALYSYARGGTDITGPSIRLAECIAQQWGNMQFGIRELSQTDTESTVEAFAWDVETNTRQVKVFQVPHVRHTRQGAKKLTDPRDIYETVANQGARRLRACILGVVPGDVIDAAVQQAELTLTTKVELTPERITAMVKAFETFRVTRQQIEQRIQRRIDAMTPALFVALGKIHNSLRDGMSAPADWFEPVATKAPDAPADPTPPPAAETLPSAALPESVQATNLLLDRILAAETIVELNKLAGEVIVAPADARPALKAAFEARRRELKGDPA